MMTTKKRTLLTKLALVALILLTMAIYMPPFIRSFVGDDYIQFDYVKRFVLNPTTIWQLFNPQAVPWYFRPTQNIWFWLNRLILGREPFGYYIILLWFHAIAIALMYRVARQFGLGLLAAFVTAVLLAIHSHWVDVVSWISSVAIVLGAIFSLWAVSAMLAYVKRPSGRQLSLIFGITLLTFLTHEEAILLPPLLLLLLLMARWEQQKLEVGDRRLKGRKRQMRPSPISHLQSLITKQEIIIFSLLFLITIVYLVIQFTRPNPTVQVAERSLAEWLTYLRWPQIAGFVQKTAFRLSFVTAVLSLSGYAANVLVVGLLMGLGVWFWKGNWVIRFGLVWLLAHLFFIYWALWSQLPNLYAGRHIYQGGIGLALAIGATIEILILNAKGQRGKGVKEGKWVQTRENQVAMVVLVLLTAVTLHHIRQTREAQQSWLANVTEEEVAKAQLLKLLPTLTPESHIFSYRFPITPDFTRSVAQLWYDVPLTRPGGSIKHLAAHGRATPDFIVLDYENGQVYNLMPELQQFAETIFLWAADDGSEVTVASGSNGNQLAISQTPTVGNWIATTYLVDVPEGAALHTAVLAQPGIAYRLSLEDEQLFEQAPLPEGAPAVWVEVALPLATFVGQEIEVRLEATAVTETEALAYWANPRLVVE